MASAALDCPENKFQVIRGSKVKKKKKKSFCDVRGQSYQNAFCIIKAFLILKMRSDVCLYFESCVAGYSSGINMPSVNVNMR